MPAKVDRRGTMGAKSKSRMSDSTATSDPPKDHLDKTRTPIPWEVPYSSEYPMQLTGAEQTAEPTAGTPIIRNITVRIQTLVSRRSNHVFWSSDSIASEVDVDDGPRFSGISCFTDY